MSAFSYHFFVASSFHSPSHCAGHIIGTQLIWDEQMNEIDTRIFITLCTFKCFPLEL